MKLGGLPIGMKAGHESSRTQEAWREAIDRMGAAIRALRFVGSDLQLGEIERQCRTVRRLAEGEGAVSSCRVAEKMERLARTYSGESWAISGADLRALTRGQRWLASSVAAVASGDRPPEAKGVHAYLRARLGRR